MLEIPPLPFLIVTIIVLSYFYTHNSLQWDTITFIISQIHTNGAFYLEVASK